MKSNRRNALKFSSAVLGAILVKNSAMNAAPAPALYRVKNNRINQSVIQWCFNPMTVEELAAASAPMGLKSVELVGPEHWAMLKKYGLTCAIAGSHGFAKGFAHKEEHAECLTILEKRIDECAAAGVPSVITFSGFRRGLSDDEGTANMIAGLKKIAGQAERKKVTVCLEMLNSKVDVTMKGHPDYFCDNMDKSIEILKQVGSERVKVLFDIYHVQIMHGDIISRIKQHHAWVGHYHTAGNPGRNEIDDTQEINYPPIMKAILATGYQGYIGQEFIPLRDKVTSLNQAVQICDV